MFDRSSVRAAALSLLASDLLFFLLLSLHVIVRPNRNDMTAKMTSLHSLRACGPLVAVSRTVLRSPAPAFASIRTQSQHRLLSNASAATARATKPSASSSLPANDDDEKTNTEQQLDQSTSDESSFEAGDLAKHVNELRQSAARQRLADIVQEVNASIPLIRQSDASVKAQSAVTEAIDASRSGQSSSELNPNPFAPLSALSPARLRMQQIRLQMQQEIDQNTQQLKHKQAADDAAAGSVSASTPALVRSASSAGTVSDETKVNRSHASASPSASSNDATTNAVDSSRLSAETSNQSLRQRISAWAKSRHAQRELNFNAMQNDLIDSLTLTSQLRLLKQDVKGKNISCMRDIVPAHDASPFLSPNLPKDSSAKAVRQQQGKVMMRDLNYENVKLHDLIDKPGRITLLTVSYNGGAAKHAAKWCSDFMSEFVATAPVQCIQININSTQLMRVGLFQIWTVYTMAQTMRKIESQHNRVYTVFDPASIQRLERLDEHHIRRRNLMTQVFLIDAQGRWRWKAYHEATPEDQAVLTKCTMQLIQQQQQAQQQADSSLEQ